jgi:hypothetical protein
MDGEDNGMSESQKLPDLKTLSDEERNELASIMYAINLVRQETGYGTVEIELRGGKITDMQATHKIRPSTFT